jgi:hypothetical protein
MKLTTNVHNCVLGDCDTPRPSGGGYRHFNDGTFDENVQLVTFLTILVAAPACSDLPLVPLGSVCVFLGSDC